MTPDVNRSMTDKLFSNKPSILPRVPRHSRDFPWITIRPTYSMECRILKNQICIILGTRQTCPRETRCDRALEQNSVRASTAFHKVPQIICMCAYCAWKRAVCVLYDRANKIIFYLPSRIMTCSPSVDSDCSAPRSSSSTRSRSYVQILQHTLTPLFFYPNICIGSGAL